MRFLILAVAICAGQLDAQGIFVGARAGQVMPRQFLRDFFNSPIIVAREASVASGFSATLEATRWLAFETDLMLVEKGMHLGTNNRLTIDYLEMPVLLRLASPVRVFGIQPFVQGGFAPSIETWCDGISEAARNILEVAVLGEANDVQLRRDCQNWRDTRRDFGRVTAWGLLLRRRTFQITVSKRNTYGVRDLVHDEAGTQRFNETNAFLIGFVARLK